MARREMMHREAFSTFFSTKKSTEKNYFVLFALGQIL
jgi:hypothetical protein